jgi:hypothetical protein
LLPEVGKATLVTFAFVALVALPDNGPLNPAAVIVPAAVVLPFSKLTEKLLAPALLTIFQVLEAVVD